MPRLSKKAKEEWSLFIHPETGRRTYNELRRKCARPCKQSYRALVIECPKFYGKWSERRERKKVLEAEQM